MLINACASETGSEHLLVRAYEQRAVKSEADVVAVGALSLANAQTLRLWSIVTQLDSSKRRLLHSVLIEPSETSKLEASV